MLSYVDYSNPYIRCQNPQVVEPEYISKSYEFPLTSCMTSQIHPNYYREHRCLAFRFGGFVCPYITRGSRQAVGPSTLRML